MNQIYQVIYHSPIGKLEINAGTAGIQSILFIEKKEQAIPQVIPTNSVDQNMPDALQQCVVQLDEYFLGKRTEFDVPLAPQGTGFQKRVWEALREIPLGQISTYKKIAQNVDLPKGAQAIGGANGQNPISIIVPCHRVIGSNGTLTGYAGGLWRKEWLLQHEKVKLPGKQLSLI